MKSPLRYQATGADCGKTSFVNAFMYLFERDEIPPQAIDFVTRVTGDCNLGVNGYYRGTSANSMAFLAAWCNDYLVKAGMPIRCQVLRDDEVSMKDGSPLVEGLRSGAVAVCGCRLFVDHYVLITGMGKSDALIFDPFYDTFPRRGCAVGVGRAVLAQPNRLAQGARQPRVGGILVACGVRS